MRRDQLYINAGDSLFDNDCFKAILGIDVEYQRSFKDCRLTRGLFGKGALSFSGSQATTRAAGDLIAENFGLSDVLPTTALSFCPRVSGWIVDFRAHFALDNWWEGMYFTVSAPFEHAEWELNPGCSCNNSCNNGCSTGCSTGCGNSCGNSCNNSCNSCCTTATVGDLTATAFKCGYMTTATDCSTNGVGANRTKTNLPATSFNAALGGDYLFGDMQTAWQFGRFKFCKQTKNAVAAVDMLLGWNFKRCQDHHVGVYIRAVAPTGNNPNPRNVFSPVVGYGKHWELGLGVTSHWKMWSCDEDQDLTAWFDGNFTHLFKNCQTRSFDFQGKGCLSRYMLLKTFNQDNVYQGLINGINFATRNADVSIAIKGEAMVEFVYRNGGLRLGLGADLWGMTKEKICIKSGAACSTLDADLKYGFKGCEGVSARQYTSVNGLTTGVLTEVTPRTLNSTSSNATITTCGNVDNGVAAVTPDPATNPSLALDYRSATPSVGTTTFAGVYDGGYVGAYRGALNSNPPINNLSIYDLSASSAANPAEVSGSIFGTASYAWTDCDWSPVLGGGLSGEFSGRNGTLNQWGIWLNGSVTF